MCIFIYVLYGTLSVKNCANIVAMVLLPISSVHNNEEEEKVIQSLPISNASVQCSAPSSVHLKGTNVSKLRKRLWFGLLVIVNLANFGQNNVDTLDLYY